MSFGITSSRILQDVFFSLHSIAYFYITWIFIVWHTCFSKYYIFCNSVFFWDISEGDPNNYLTFYKRGTIYLALGKSKFAILDLDRVLQLKPDFIAARVQRGNVLLKQGQLDAAEEDFIHVVSYYQSMLTRLLSC